MEPWHFSHGELRDGGVSWRLIAASMEPWHFSHGELSVSVLEALADAKLQWSHGILAMERMIRDMADIWDDMASMEPWHFSHGESASDTPTAHTPSSFNGAMAF